MNVRIRVSLSFRGSAREHILTARKRAGHVLAQKEHLKRGELDFFIPFGHFGRACVLDLFMRPGCSVRYHVHGLQHPSTAGPRGLDNLGLPMLPTFLQEPMATVDCVGVAAQARWDTIARNWQLVQKAMLREKMLLLGGFEPPPGLL